MAFEEEEAQVQEGERGDKGWEWPGGGGGGEENGSGAPRLRGGEMAALEDPGAASGGTERQRHGRGWEGGARRSQSEGAQEAGSGLGWACLATP